MKTSVHLPQDLAARLEQHLEQNQSYNKNRILVIALTEYLDRAENQVDWSPEFLAWAEQPESSEGLEIDRSSWREIEL